MISEKTIRRMLEEIDDGKGIINEEVMENTPGRVCRMYNNELLSGYATDPTALFGRTFESEFNDMVVVTNITFSSLCEHHMLPMTGTAHIGYLPRDGKLLGLSKLSRIVDCYAKRLQLQERIAADIVDGFMKHLSPLGVGVVIEAEHGCMSIRGVNKPDCRTVVSAMRGSFLTDRPTQQEFLRLIELHKNGG